MKTKFTIAILAILFTLQLSAQNYKIDPSHSTVQIQVDLQ
jgi:polyisoprenoid-binding protein YceI